MNSLLILIITGANTTEDYQFWAMLFERYGLIAILLFFLANLVAKGVISKTEKILKKVEKLSENSADIKAKNKEVARIVIEKFSLIEQALNGDDPSSNLDSRDLHRKLDETAIAINQRGRRRDNEILDNLKQVLSALARIETLLSEKEQSSRSWGRWKK